MTNVGLMISLEVAVVLLVVNWVHLTSPLSDQCLRDLDYGQDLSVIPVGITCAASLNGILNTWWTVGDHVELVTLDYNCTGFGVDQAENLHSWVQGSRGEPIADITDLMPNASSNSSDTDLTCYVDGCFVWSSGRDIGLTWSIPTVTCNLSTTLQTASKTVWSAEVSSVVILTSTTISTTNPTMATTTQPLSGGLKPYILFVLMLLPMLAIIPFIPIFIRWRVKRKRKGKWWLHGTNRDKKVLLGNEPCIDPMYRVKNDYFETITIVDPLELPEQVESGLRVTTIIPAHVENHFLEDFNQQAGDSEGHSFSESRSSGSIQVESTTGEEAENDSVSACTQKIESGGDTGVQQSGSEQEGPISDDTNAEGASACVKPTGLSVQEHCPPTTETELSHSNQIQTANEVAPPPEPAKVVTTSISGSESPQDNCFSTDDSQRKLLCSTPSPEHSGLSTNGASPVINLITKGASAPVRPTSLKLRPKHCPPSIRRGELSHPNQNSNTKGARRPTSLNLHIEHCPPSTGRGELSHPNQIAMNLDTKGACPRPASLNLRIEHRAPSTGRDELSRPNRNSINEGEQIGPTSLDHQKHCPPPTERDSNQIQMADKVASLPEPANVVVISTSTPGGSASAKSANAANQTDSLGIGSSPVLEQVYRNVDLDACGHASEHLHGRQGLQLSRVDPLSIIPEEIQSEDHTRYQSSPSYISSSECTSSIYSSAQGTNGGVGYLADIEDMDSTSLQSDLESDEGTKDDPNKLNGENRKECEPESIQDMIQRLLHHSIPPRVQWYNKKHQPLQDHFLSEDDSEVDYIYIATIPPVDLPDSPCSELGYIVLPQTAELSEDDDEDTFGLEDEVTARPAHTDTPNSGYISSGPQTEICDDVQPVPA